MEEALQLAESVLAGPLLSPTHRLRLKLLKFCSTLFTYCCSFLILWHCTFSLQRVTELPSFLSEGSAHISLQRVGTVLLSFLSEGSANFSLQRVLLSFLSEGSAHFSLLKVLVLLSCLSDGNSQFSLLRVLISCLSDGNAQFSLQRGSAVSQKAILNFLFKRFCSVSSQMAMLSFLFK